MSLKSFAEQLTGARIYRNTLPRGTELIRDFGRYRHRCPLRTMIDVGANVGQTALAFSQSFPGLRVYSFEPIRATFEKLKANTGDRPEIECFNLACGSENSTVEVNLKATSTHNSILRGKDRPDNEDPVETIQVRRLDDVIKEHQISDVDFLKIDTEGFDLEVLKGAPELLQSESLKFVEVEAGLGRPSPVLVQLDEFRQFLLKYDFVFFGLYDQRAHHDGRIQMELCNAVFIAERWANPPAQGVPGNTSAR